MVLRNWLRRFVAGDPVCKVADTRNLNRIANVIEDLEVVGKDGIDAQISKPTGNEGFGWTITVSGAKIVSYTLTQIKKAIENSDPGEPSPTTNLFTEIITTILENTETLTEVVTQLVNNELHPSSTDEVAKILGGSGQSASADTWNLGEVDPITGKPTYPVFKPFRIFWNSSTNTLYWFYRTLTYNSAGLLVAVSAETSDSATISGGGTSGFTGQRTVVTDVSWDEEYHRFRQTKETWNYTNGLLQTSVTSATTTIVTAVPEMP